MKQLVKISAIAMLVAVSFASCSKNVSKLDNDIDSLSYAFGTNIGMMFKSNIDQIPGGKNKIDSIVQGFKAGLGKEQAYVFGMSYSANVAQQVKQMTDGEDVNEDVLVKAFIAALEGDTTSTPIMDEQSAMMFLRSYVSPKIKKENAENLSKGQAFLAEQEKKTGVVKTESGLLYEVVTEGNGAKPSAEDRVKVNYKGTLIDGTEFDKGEGVEFGANQVIKGWTEGLQLMNVGSSYKFYIPANLAYGEQQASELIKPNSALVFEVTLVEIVKAKK